MKLEKYKRFLCQNLDPLISIFPLQVLIVDYTVPGFSIHDDLLIDLIRFTSWQRGHGGVISAQSIEDFFYNVFLKSQVAREAIDSSNSKDPLAKWNALNTTFSGYYSQSVLAESHIQIEDTMSSFGIFWKTRSILTVHSALEYIAYNEFITVLLSHHKQHWPDREQVIGVDIIGVTKNGWVSVEIY